LIIPTPALPVICRWRRWARPWRFTPAIEPIIPSTVDSATVSDPGLAIVPADERHLDAMMTIMHAAFDPHHGEAWSSAQLGGTLSMPGCWGRLALLGAQAAGFSLCRVAGPEVELLLIAVNPDLRRRAIGYRLLMRAQEDAMARGASELFLEVREDNETAKYLYDMAGFLQVGRRPDYYMAKDGSRRAAISMRIDLEHLIR
jgi:[ribosomal protein S18]-alanine N-acetyltransferase